MVPLSAKATSEGIDQQVDSLLQPVAALFISVIFYSVSIAGADVPLIVVWLITAALIFTLYFGFINLRGFSHSIKVIRGDYYNPNDPARYRIFKR